jgi:hypothetical protein
MEKNLYHFDNEECQRIRPEEFDKEELMQDILEKIIKHEKYFFEHRIIAYCREPKISNAGRADFFLLDNEQRLIIIECKRSQDAGIRRKVIAQLIDYASNSRTQELRNVKWKKLGEDVKDITLSGSEPILYVVADKINKELHRITQFLKEKQITINLATVNKFNLNNKYYYSITPHLSKDFKIESKDSVESFLKTVKNSSMFAAIIQLTDESRYIANVKRQKTMRMSIHIKGSEERFPLWLSQENMRNINKENISFPKPTFCPCSTDSYDKVIQKVKELLKDSLIQHEHGDVSYYVAIEHVDKEKYMEILEVISDILI